MTKIPRLKIEQLPHHMMTEAEDSDALTSKFGNTTSHNEGDYAGQGECLYTKFII
jgi:hypothetical protein